MQGVINFNAPLSLRDICFPFPYSVYITWMYLVVMYIVPFTCLAAFNLRIYMQIRRANTERAQLSRMQQREIRMATMLMIVVLVFFMCNVLALVINLLEVRQPRCSTADRPTEASNAENERAKYSNVGEEEIERENIKAHSGGETALGKMPTTSAVWLLGP